MDEARVLNNLAQLHVVDHLHAQGAICADRVIDRTAHQVESAYPHVVLRLGISDLPWPVSKNEKRLEERDHHSLARALHDHAREKNNVVGSFRLRVSHRAPQSIGLEEDVGIGKEQPLPRRLQSGRPHSVRFAEPPRGQFRNVDHLQSCVADTSVRLRVQHHAPIVEQNVFSNLIHDLPGAVG